MNKCSFRILNINVNTSVHYSFYPQNTRMNHSRVVLRVDLALMAAEVKASERKIKLFQLDEDKGLSSKFIHAYILPGVWRTCVINADRRSIRNLPQNFSGAGSKVRKALPSIAHLNTQLDIDTTASTLAQLIFWSRAILLGRKGGFICVPDFYVMSNKNSYHPISSLPSSPPWHIKWGF